MKVLLVNSVYGVGSTGKIVKDLQSGLLANSHTVKICYGRGPKQDGATRICSKASVYAHALVSRLFGINGRYSKRATAKLICEVEAYQPDVVHLHNIHGYYLDFYQFISYLKKKQIPVVWTLHDELMFTGNCGYAYSCNGWKHDCRHCPRKREYPSSLLFDFATVQLKWKRELFQRMEHFCFVTPSEWLKGRVEQSVLQSARIQVIHNGIDIDLFNISSDADELKGRLGAQKKKIVLTVTDDVNDPRKGMDCLMELARMSQEENILFVVVGGVRTDCREKNIVFVERTNDRKELASYYSAADVFLIPSKCDNFPTVCLESLACGTPVVGFHAGGIAETAQDDSVGLFTEAGNIEELQHSLQTMLLRDRELVRNQCRAYAVGRYDKKIMVENYLELYHSLQQS
ncbi:MAG: glycosyltransferase [Clostridia bacterium]|nr:glycosyltransferase [Clostridia bacterium]